MIITYQEKNYYKISSGNITILLNPTNQRSYKSATIALFTEKNITNNENNDGIFCIDHPGEFEINNIQINGWPIGFDTNNIFTAYKIIFDEISIGIILNASEIPQEFKEYFEGVDIIIVSGFEKNGIDINQLRQFIRQIEPAIIIPTSNGLEKNIINFTKQFGIENIGSEEKLVIKKKEIKEKEMKIICLKSE